MDDRRCVAGQRLMALPDILDVLSLHQILSRFRLRPAAGPNEHNETVKPIFDRRSLESFSSSLFL